MTRLEQALRWWRNHDECSIPSRHVNALVAAGYLGPEDEDGCRGLTPKGVKAVSELTR